MGLIQARHRLEIIDSKILGDEHALGIAQNRWHANHIRAVANHRAGLLSEREANRLVKRHHPTAADDMAARAARQHSRAYKAHARATYWVGEAKVLNAKIYHLTQSQTQVEDKIHELVIESGAHYDLSANKVTGGTPIQRVGLAIHVSMAHAIEYYSQTGTWSVDYCLTGPPYGYRYDCSSWFTSVYWTCDLPDPNGSNYGSGYTGTLGLHGHDVAEHELDTGDAILFGYAPFHHVEMKDGPMSQSPYTVGHGSAAVNRGVVALLPGPRAYRRYL